MKIRAYRPSDCAALADLFYQTVHAVNVRDYSEAQCNAWATGEVDLEAWNRSFLSHHTFVAEEEEKIVGFGDIDGTGYLDRLYVHKDFQRRGIATALCQKMEHVLEGKTITTHASITARPFLSSGGYRVVQEQTVQRHGVSLQNYVMERRHS